MLAMAMPAAYRGPVTWDEREKKRRERGRITRTLLLSSFCLESSKRDICLALPRSRAVCLKLVRSGSSGGGFDGGGFDGGGDKSGLGREKERRVINREETHSKDEPMRLDGTEKLNCQIDIYLTTGE